jgi:hypothetical protein
MVKKVKQNQSLQFAVINPCCAAIDVGSMMMVSYSDEQGNQHLLEVDAFTESLQQLASTLKQAGVTHVAMEATGIYWIVVYEILEQQGFQLTLGKHPHWRRYAVWLLCGWVSVPLKILYTIKVSNFIISKSPLPP